MSRSARSRGHRGTVLRSLQATGIAIRQRGLSPDVLAQAAALYQAGWSLARLGEKYGCDDMAVRRALALHGVKIRSRRGRT